MIPLVVIGGVFLVWLLLNAQQSAAVNDATKVKGTSLDDVTGKGDIYSRGLNLVYNAVTNPNEIQHALGLAGSDGWGEGEIYGVDYESLPPDVKLYRRMSEYAKFAQNLSTTPENIRRMCYSAAIYMMPALREGTCCDFDPNVPLAKGGGHMRYMGNYNVRFNQNGSYRNGVMRKMDPPKSGEGTDAYIARLHIPMYYGTIPYNT